MPASRMRPACLWAGYRQRTVTLPRGATEFVVDQCDVEAELAGVVGFEAVDFELDDDVAELVGVEEHQVGEVVLAVDVEPELPADEGESASEFHQGVGEAVHEGLLEVPFGGPLPQGQEVEHVGVLDHLGGAAGLVGFEVLVEIGGGCAESGVQAGGQVVVQDRAGPGVLDGLGGVPPT